MRGHSDIKDGCTDHEDTLSPVTSKMDAQIMKSILHGVTMGMTNRGDAQDPAVAKADEDLHKPVQETGSG